jgi:rhodanese-related sulfurtransferase
MDRLFEFAGHHPLLVSAAALIALLVLAYEARLKIQSAAAISPQELIRLMNQGALVLDLRPADEYAAGHINGARPMPSDQLSRAGDTLKKHKEKLVVVYCDGGAHAPAAARKLAAQGFTKVFSLRGGLSAWRAENLPLAKA